MRLRIVAGLFALAIATALSGCSTQQMVDAMPKGSTQASSIWLASSPTRIKSLVVLQGEITPYDISKPAGAIPLNRSVAIYKLEKTLREKGLVVGSLDIKAQDVNRRLREMAEAQSASHYLNLFIPKAVVKTTTSTAGQSSTLGDASIVVEVYDIKTKLVVWRYTAETKVNRFTFELAPDYSISIIESMMKDGLI